jgi:hypothetical protein
MCTRYAYEVEVAEVCILSLSTKGALPLSNEALNELIVPVFVEDVYLSTRYIV